MVMGAYGTLPSLTGLGLVPSGTGPGYVWTGDLRKRHAALLEDLAKAEAAYGVEAADAASADAAKALVRTTELGKLMDAWKPPVEMEWPARPMAPAAEAMPARGKPQTDRGAMVALGLLGALGAGANPMAAYLGAAKREADEGYERSLAEWKERLRASAVAHEEALAARDDAIKLRTYEQTRTDNFADRQYERLMAFKGLKGGAEQKVAEAETAARLSRSRLPVLLGKARADAMGEQVAAAEAMQKALIAAETRIRNTSLQGANAQTLQGLKTEGALQVVGAKGAEQRLTGAQTADAAMARLGKTLASKLTVVGIQQAGAKARNDATIAGAAARAAGKPTGGMGEGARVQYARLVSREHVAAAMTQEALVRLYAGWLTKSDEEREKLAPGLSIGKIRELLDQARRLYNAEVKLAAQAFEKAYKEQGPVAPVMGQGVPSPPPHAAALAEAEKRNRAAQRKPSFWGRQSFSTPTAAGKGKPAQIKKQGSVAGVKYRIE